jgi:hypothetical protein
MQGLGMADRSYDPASAQNALGGLGSQAGIGGLMGMTSTTAGFYIGHGGGFSIIAPISTHDLVTTSETITVTAGPVIEERPDGEMSFAELNEICPPKSDT